MKDVFTERKEDKLIVDYMNSLMDRAKATLNEDTDAEVIDKFTSIFQDNVMNVMLQMVDGNLSEPNAVVCHGDCWNNNLLFKYDVSISMLQEYENFTYWILHPTEYWETN